MSERKLAIEKALQAIREKHDTVRHSERSSYIKKRYRLVPTLIKLLSTPEKLSREELAVLLREQFIHILAKQVIPTKKAYEHLAAYFLYIEAMHGTPGKEYLQAIESAFAKE
ncbi:hypothetical protein [Chrysiogenes arsenatis]|uniref:hypothetical protein n=1 Tax=Chrysiogenes arsenatis TaxID=309797 RepID=UPI0003FAA166|nr:hypothetical protein [Chrysiogenes arsenatis]